MKNLKQFGFSLLIAGLSVGTLSAQSAATLSGRIGTVEVQRRGAWTEARFSEQISPGERVRTGDRSSAAIDLGPGKVATLAENTEVEVRDGGGDSLNVRLESGNMRVVSASDVQVSARDTAAESSARRPLDLDRGSQADELNLTITGRTGPIIIRGDAGSTKRGSQPEVNPSQYGVPFGYSNIYGNPFGFSGYYTYPFVFGNPGFVQPTIQNPYSGITPGQVIAPMTDPLRPPVHFPIDTFPNRAPFK